MQQLITDIELDNIFNKFKELKEEEINLENQLDEIVIKCDELISILQYYKIHVIKEALKRQQLNIFPKALYKTTSWYKTVENYE